MHLKKLVLKNFGPHRHLDLNLANGLIAVLGPNGAGKSHITDGIFMLLTGNYDRFGLKEQIVNLRAPESEESSIFGEFVHHDLTVQLYRGLRPAKAWLRINDGAPITKAPQIQAELEKRLGVNPRLLAAYSLVAQWEMFNFLSQTPGERAAAYQQLCDTGKAQEICKAIDQLLAQDPVINAVVEDNGDTLRATLGQARHQLDDANAALNDASANLLSPDALTAASAIVEKRRTWERYEPELRELSKQLMDRDKAIKAGQVTLQSRQTLLAEAQTLMDTLAVQEREARQHQEAAGRLAVVRSRRSVARNSLKALQQKLPPEPQPHRQAEHADNLKQELHVKHAECLRLKQMLSVFQQDGVVQCPTCGTPVTQLHDHLAKLPEQISNYESREAGLQKLLADIRHQKKAISDWQATKSRHDQEVARLQAVIEQPDPEADPSGSPSDWAEAIADYNQQVTLVRDAQTMFNASNTEMTRLQALQTADQERYERTARAVADNVVPNDKYHAAYAALEKHKQADYQCGMLDARVTMARQEVDRLEKELAALEARLARGRKAAAFRQTLLTIRDQVMHRQQLPRLVAESNLRAMESDINRGLESFGSPFWVDATEDLSFQAHFPGMEPIPAAKLSGGEKVVLALNFRPAVASLFGAGLGMLCLDEPSAGLDSNNLHYLATALSGYADRVRGRQQVIVITHAAELSPSFDQCVSLEKT